MRLVHMLLLVLIEVMWIKRTTAAPKLWTTPARRNINSGLPHQEHLDPEVPSQAEVPSQQDLDPEVNSQEDLNPEVPSQEDLDHEVPSQEDVDPEIPSQQDLDPEVPSQQDLDHEVPSQAEVPSQQVLDPEIPSQEDLEPEVPSQQDLEPEVPSQQDLDPEVPSQQDLDPSNSRLNESENHAEEELAHDHIKIQEKDESNWENVETTEAIKDKAELHGKKEMEIFNVIGEKEIVSEGRVETANPLNNETDEKSHKFLQNTKELVKSEEENSRMDLVEDEVHDSSNKMDTLLAAINGSDLGSFTYPDYAANEMIDKLGADTEVFEALRKKIHYLEESMNKHKNVKLVDRNQVEDAQMILEIMDKKMLKPFSLTLGDVREEIIKMDHSLRGDTLDYVKGLVKRAENFINDAQEKLETVVETDKEWTSYENSNNIEEVIDKKDVANVTKDIKKENDNSLEREIDEAIAVAWTNKEKSVEIKSAEEIHNESLKFHPTIAKAIKEDVVSQYGNLDNLEKSNNDQIPSSMSNDLKDQVVVKQKNVEVTERREDVIVDNERMMNPKIKLLLETTEFLKNNNEPTHKHDISKEENVSWVAGELMLPFFTFVVLSAAIIAIIFTRIKKKKQIISVNSLNSWGNDYGLLETVSTLQNPNYNYYKFK